MTFIFGVTGERSIWLAADRRLTAKGRAPNDGGCKVVFLQTREANAILGYAGLGATGRGVEISTWISRVLRGRNGTLEQCLDAILQAMLKEMPHHLWSLSPGQPVSHHILAPAFVEQKPVCYSVDLALSGDRKRKFKRFTRWVTEYPNVEPRTARIMLAGSGAVHASSDSQSQREILRLVKAHEKGRISALAVADWFAAFNERIHKRDGHVGPNCIVAWRYREQGGAHEFYEGRQRSSAKSDIPTILTGTDLSAMFKAIGPMMFKHLEDHREGRPSEIDADEMNRLLSQLPSEPDDKLR